MEIGDLDEMVNKKAKLGAGALTIAEDVGQVKEPGTLYAPDEKGEPELALVLRTS